MFSQTFTGDVTSELSPHGSEAKTTMHTTARTKKLLASHRNVAGPAVAQFIKNHSLGNRNFGSRQNTDGHTGRFSGTTANTFRDGKRSVSARGKESGPTKALILRKYNNIDFDQN